VLAGAVIGRSGFDIPGTAEAMARAVRDFGRGGVAATAISAVDMALWDLKARLLGLPVAGSLGRARAQVPVCGSGGFTSYDEQQTREQLSRWVEEDGIPRVKIKIGEAQCGNERRDLERTAVAREVTGPERAVALAAAHNMQVSAHCAPNLHAHVADAAQNLRHVEYFHDHQRIERLPFDGALDPPADPRPAADGGPDPCDRQMAHRKDDR
jgi:hypothetical protein